MSDKAHEVLEDGRDEDVRSRRPYEPPRLVSGPAFERVVLQSGCLSAFGQCQGETNPACS